MSYHYADIEISFENNHFFHHLKNDYECIILWESARPYKEWIRELIFSQFEIVLETEIEWSKTNFHDNASRFYKRPLYASIPKESRFSEKAWQIGDPIFFLFVIKDSNPAYSYLKTTSNIIEAGNLNIYNLKDRIRKTIYDEIGAHYPIHSTNGIHEFCFQMPLLLGPGLFIDLLNGTRTAIKRISKDLEGADGWPDWETAFEVLNLTSNYLLLNSHNGLPNGNWNKNPIFLTDNYQQLASALNVFQLSADGSKGHVQVNGQLIPVTIRFIGDNYRSTSWQKDMLYHKVNENGVYVLRPDMYFFSLLFDKVNHYPISKKDMEGLTHIADKLGFAWYDEKTVSNDEIVGQWLGGYFKAHGYHYDDPIDKNLRKNKKLVRHLPDSKSLVIKESNKTRIKRTIKNILPKTLFSLLKKMIGKR